MWRPIEFRSKRFSPADRGKAAHTRELLSFVGALRYFKSFLAGIPFEVITDSSAVAWLKNGREQSPSFQRWWAHLSLAEVLRSGARDTREHRVRDSLY